MTPTPPFPLIDAASIEAELQATLPALFGAGLTSTEVKKAFGHQTFLIHASDGRSYLLKVARLEAEISRLEAVASSVELARSGGVRTPEISRVAPAALRFGKRPYLLQEFLPGKDAEDLWPSLEPARRSSILADLGREVARLHAITSRTFTESPVDPGQEGDWAAHVSGRLWRMIQDNQKAQALSSAELRAAEGRIKTLLPACASVVQPTLTHRDLCLRNVLVSPAGAFAALLDFEHARFSDPVMDFVKPKLWLFESDPGAETAFFSGYRGERADPWPREAERHELGLLLELLGEIPYFKRNSAQAELSQAVARLRATLASG